MSFNWQNGPLVSSIINGDICVLDNYTYASNDLKSNIQSLILNKAITANSNKFFFNYRFRIIIIAETEDDLP